VSDSKKIQSLPPDDFSKTTPNINLPKDRLPPTSGWEKTNYNFPAQPPADDWGNTVANIRPIETDDSDFGRTYLPGSQKQSPPADWGMTAANINLTDADFGSNQRNFNNSAQEDMTAGYGVTTPYFRLPETERQKYKNLPPTPTEKAEQERREKEEKGGVPTWVWISGGLMSMFFFAVAVLMLVYFFILSDRGFEATVVQAPPGSRVLVDNYQWNVSSEDGSYKLPSLKAGRRKIDIVHPNFTCDTLDIEGKDGVNPEPVRARCKPVAVQPGEDCNNIRLGEFDKAERCYNAALDGLPDPFTPEDLMKALNILIINFESNKFDIPPVRLAALQKGASFIKKLPPSVVIEVGGHTDSDGSDSANQTLSEKRATAVRDQLVKYQVNPEVLQTKGYGETQPKTTNETQDGKFYNRRIQYSVVKK
jgi:outer membrane protein OmpA-like peptidoglycan-associated protein